MSGRSEGSVTPTYTGVAGDRLKNDKVDLFKRLVSDRRAQEQEAALATDSDAPGYILSETSVYLVGTVNLQTLTAVFSDTFTSEEIFFILNQAVINSVKADALEVISKAWLKHTKKDKAADVATLVSLALDQKKFAAYSLLLKTLSTCLSTSPVSERVVGKLAAVCLKALKLETDENDFATPATNIFLKQYQTSENYTRHIINLLAVSCLHKLYNIFINILNLFCSKRQPNAKPSLFDTLETAALEIIHQPSCQKQKPYLTAILDKRLENDIYHNKEQAVCIANTVQSALHLLKAALENNNLHLVEVILQKLFLNIVDQNLRQQFLSDKTLTQLLTLANCYQHQTFLSTMAQCLAEMLFTEVEHNPHKKYAVTETMHKLLEDKHLGEHLAMAMHKQFLERLPRCDTVHLEIHGYYGLLLHEYIRHLSRYHFTDAQLSDPEKQRCQKLAEVLANKSLEDYALICYYLADALNPAGQLYKLIIFPNTERMYHGEVPATSTEGPTQQKFCGYYTTLSEHQCRTPARAVAKALIHLYYTTQWASKDNGAHQDCVESHLEIMQRLQHETQVYQLILKAWQRLKAIMLPQLNAANDTNKFLTRQLDVIDHKIQSATQVPGSQRVAACMAW